MARIALAPPRRTNFALWALVLLGVASLSLVPLALNTGGTKNASTPVLAAETPRIAYFEFDTTADTLWLANPLSPSSRTKGLTIPHAPEYGVVPSLSPDGKSVAYLVLPTNTAAPGPDSPAQLWVASVEGGEPKLLASDAALLVPAVWSADGAVLVYRHSEVESSSLKRVSIGSGETTDVKTSAASLFPIAFDGSTLWYAEVSQTGSDLYSTASNAPLRLSDGLTRDWALSPDGARLAYLEMTLSDAAASSRAFVLDLKNGERSAVGSPAADAFSPAWAPDGSLVIGQLATGATSTAAAVIGADGDTRLSAPRRGFDVPLAVDTDAGAAMTSFDGNSITNPGRATLVVVAPDGNRRQIASGEVTFLGWIHP
jgi:hypothetical protein